MSEEEYFTIRHFVNYHRYPITKTLLAQAEREILTRCHTERIRIKITHHLGAERFPTRAYPRWLLEEYFALWVK
jgi:hypothetical protein